MPITAENYRRAEEALARAKMNPNEDPAKIARVEAQLQAFYASSPEQPSNPIPEGPPAPPQSDFQGRGSVAGYFYNPSVDEFRSAIKDRSVREKLGLGDAYSSGETSGESYLKSQVPELSSYGKADINQLSEQSDEYKRYSEYAYQQALAKDPSIKRYDDLDIMDNPGKKALGAVIKYGPAALLGAERSLLMGAGKGAVAEAMVNDPAEPGSRAARVARPAQSAEQTAADQRTKENVLETARDLESLSPAASTIGGLVAYASPAAPANLAQKSLETAVKYGARNPFNKALASAGIGAVTSVGEGAVQDVAEDPSVSGQQLIDNSADRAMWGAALGGAGDLVAQGAKKTQQTLRESPRWRPVKTLEDVGGNTNVFTGVSAPDAVRQNITDASVSREFRTGGDIAAQKVAPQIQKSVDDQIEAQRKLSAQELEDYISQPEIASQQESMKPVADGILDMFHKGTFEGAVSGDIKHPNAGAVRTFRDVLNSIGEVAHVAPEEAALFAQKQGGTMLSDNQVKALGLQGQPGTVPVYVPSKMGARALLEMEQMIDEKLKMANIEGGANNPIWKNVNRSVKSVRDRFGAPQPEFNDPGQPFAPATPKPSGVDKIQPPKPVGVDNAPMPEALPGIGNDQRLRNNPFRPNRFDPNVVVPRAPVNVAERRVADQPISHPERRIAGQITHSPSELAQASILNKPTDILDVIHQNTDENGLANVPAIVKAMGGDKEKVHRLLTEAEANGLIELRPEGGLNRYSQSDLNLMIPGHDNVPLGGVRVLDRNTPAPSSPHPGAQSSPHPSVRAPTEVTDDKIANIQAQRKNIRREPTPSEYRNPGYDPYNEANPENNWKGMTPEVEESLNQTNYYENIRRQKEEAGRYDNLRKEFGDYEAMNRPNEPIVKNEADEKMRNDYYQKRHAENKALDAERKLAKENALKAEGQTRVEDLEELGDSAIVPDSIPSSKNVRNTLASSKTELATESTVSAEEAKKIAKKNAARFRENKPLQIKSSLGAESQLDLQLLKRDISDQAKLDKTKNPLEIISSNVEKDGKVTIELKPVKEKKKDIPSDTLDDGTKVYGLSAVQRKHHKELERLNKLSQATGAGSEDSAHKKVLNFKHGEGHPYTDKALAEEADRLGIRQQLEEVAATREFPNLRARAWGGSGEGPMNALKDVIGLRMDPVLGALAGAQRNPFSPPPTSAAGRISQYLFQQGVPGYPLLEGKGGKWGSRYGNEVADRNKEKKKNK